ncbi:MAG: hypothetical protein JO112_23920 [Planctomycetes bacterium]|nr:hypothetical protein [Planctomycetota bacterium]
MTPYIIAGIQVLMMFVALFTRRTGTFPLTRWKTYYGKAAKVGGVIFILPAVFNFIVLFLLWFFRKTGQNLALKQFRAHLIPIQAWFTGACLLLAIGIVVVFGKHVDPSEQVPEKSPARDEKEERIPEREDKGGANLV